jgi:chaperonin cofactor prefoldin
LDKVVALLDSIETFLVDVVVKDQSNVGKLKKEIGTFEKEITSISSDRDNAVQLVQKLMKSQLDKSSSPSPPQMATGELSLQQKYDEINSRLQKTEEELKVQANFHNENCRVQTSKRDATRNFVIGQNFGQICSDILIFVSSKGFGTLGLDRVVSAHFKFGKMF